MFNGKRLWATLHSAPPGKRRCRPSALPTALVWILLAFLIAGAASYMQGSRYTLAGHMPAVSGPPDTAGSLAAAPPWSQVVPSVPAERAQASTPPSSSRQLPAFTPGAALQDRPPLRGDRSERRQAPRAEPAPLRTALTHPSGQLDHRTGECPLFFPHIPPEPELSTPTVAQLGVSRT